MFFLFCFRVKDYIAGGLSSKIKDPDGGIHLAKAKAGLGLMEEINAKKLKENFPMDGFTEDLNILPAISFGTIWRYMIEESDAKRQLSTAKPLVKGYNFFFKSGHVLSIKCRESDEKFYVKSQVLPSMKKNVLYNCYYCRKFWRRIKKELWLNIIIAHPQLILNQLNQKKEMVIQCQLNCYHR